MTRDERNDITNRFTYHKPFDDQSERYAEIRAMACDLAMEILGLCPESRERSLAITNLEQAVMWANASIAKNENELDEL